MKLTKLLLFLLLTLSAMAQQPNDHVSQRQLDKARREAGKHWKRGRFDRKFFNRKFGIAHPFLFGGPHFIWFGEPCHQGSQFYFGGVYWSLDQSCRDMWPSAFPWAGVYIDIFTRRVAEEALQISWGPEYKLVNPRHPGTTFDVSVSSLRK
jgi:hypothetical protein